METNGVYWLPQEKALPEKFVTGLLGYLSPEEKGNLAETDPKWAKRIIRGNNSLRVGRAKSPVVSQWVKAKLKRWMELAKTLQPVDKKQETELANTERLCQIACACAQSNHYTLWIVVDEQNQLQSIANVSTNLAKDDDVEVYELISAPWNLWRNGRVDDLGNEIPSPTRGAGTLAIAAIAKSFARAVVLDPYEQAVPFYKRCGFQENDLLSYRLSPEKAEARLGHLEIQRLDEQELIRDLTPQD